jgi:hypothetical protein
MINITLRDPLVAIEAGEWCNEQFGTDWTINSWNLLSGFEKYEFGFNNSQHATMFSLRWAEHT